VSTTSLAVPIGGDVKAALLIDDAYEGFGLLGRSRVNVAQEPIQRERAGPGEVGRIFDGLLWYTIHLDTILALQRGSRRNAVRLVCTELNWSSAGPHPLEDTTLMAIPARLLSFTMLLPLWSVAQWLPARRSENYDPNRRGGRFDLRVRVDGDVDFFIRGDRIRYVVRSGRPPEDEGSEYNRELPSGPLRGLHLEKRDGPDEIRILEEPSAHNNWALVVNIHDREGGDSRYHARITWEDSSKGGYSGWGEDPWSDRPERSVVTGAPRVDIDTAGHGEYREGRGRPRRFTRAYFDTRDPYKTEIGLGGERDRVRFYGEIVEHSGERLIVRLRDSDRGSARGQAEITLNRDHNEVENVQLRGVIDRVPVRAEFRR